MEWDIRLILDGYYEADIMMNYDYGNLYLKDELKIGRVEVCIGGQYGSICYDNEFSNSQAVSVVCSQLGFSRYG